MRQAGLLAAAGIYALTENFARLADDHRRAARLAAEAGGIPGVTVAEPETNIVMIDLDEWIELAGVLDGLRRRGVWMVQFGPRRLRAVTHLDVDDAGVECAVGALWEAVRDAARGGPGAGGARVAAGALAGDAAHPGHVTRGAPGGERRRRRAPARRGRGGAAGTRGGLT